MNDIPPAWSMASIDDCVRERRAGFWGAGERTSIRSEPVKVIRNGDINHGRLTSSAARYFSKTEAEKSAVTVDDVLITTSGHIGKSAIGAEGYCASNFVRILRADGRLVDSRYLRYALMTRRAADAMAVWSGGSTIQNLRTGFFAEHVVPLAPISEQRRIVQAIEEQFSRLDALEAHLHTMQVRSQSLRRALLLTVVPDPLPAHWQMSTVDDVGHVGLGRQRAPQYHQGSQMRPYLRVANVLEDALDLSDVMEMDFPGDHCERYRLATGDILLNEGQTPDLVGRPAMFRGELPNVCFSKTLLRFRPGPDVDGEFALLVFLRHLHTGRFRREARITTNIGHMVLARFKTVDFPVPPMVEQRRIVTAIREQLSALDRARSTLAVARKRATLLRRAVLDEAFSGRLVAQDPGDEPTSVLLERLAGGGHACHPKRERTRA